MTEPAADITDLFAFPSPLSALVTSSLLIGPTGYRRLPRQ
jgi:hypothetical protein